MASLAEPFTSTFKEEAQRYQRLYNKFSKDFKNEQVREKFERKISRTSVSGVLLSPFVFAKQPQHEKQINFIAAILNQGCHQKLVVRDPAPSRTITTEMIIWKPNNVKIT